MSDELGSNIGDDGQIVPVTEAEAEAKKVAEAEEAKKTAEAEAAKKAEAAVKKAAAKKAADAKKAEAEAEAKKAADEEAAAKVETVKPTKATIVLSENTEIPPTGLFVGFNGRGYLIRPGEEVTVPIGVVEVLENAITSAPQLDPQTNQVIGYRDRMRYPFRYIR